MMGAKDDDSASIRTVRGPPPAYSPAPQSYDQTGQQVPRPPSPAPSYRTVDPQARSWNALGSSVGESSHPTGTQALGKQRKKLQRRWRGWNTDSSSSKVEPELYGYEKLHHLISEGRVGAIQTLLTSGNVNFDPKTNHGKEALFHAIRGERETEAIINCLLDHGAEPSLADYRGWSSLLHIASKLGRTAAIRVLLKRCKVDIEEMSPNYRTPVQVAASRDHTETVSLLLEYGANYAHPTKDIPNWTTALHLAAKDGYHDTVALLLGMPDIDLHLEDHTGRRALDWAIEGDHGKTVLLFLERDPGLDPRDSSGGTFLHRAVRQGHYSVLTVLLNQGKWDINGRDGNSQTPLHLAAIGNYEKMLKLLLHKGASSAMTTNKGDSALHLALGRKGCYGVVQTLLDERAYADINQTNARGRTALHAACEQGEPHVIQLLLKMCPDLSIRDHEGYTPFTTAQNFGRVKAMQLLLTKDSNITKTHAPVPNILEAHMEQVVIPILLKKTVDVNKIIMGSTVLHHAAKKGLVEVVVLLLAQGADRNRKDREGRTPAMLAVENGHFGLLQNLGDEDWTDVKKIQRALALAISGGEKSTLQCIILNFPAHSRGKAESIALSEAALLKRDEMLKFLVDSGANINGTRERGWSPLYMAALHGDDDAARLLLSRGADPNLKSDSGATPLLQAADGGHAHLIQTLLRGGANISDVDNHGDTALHRAVRKCRYLAAALLLEEGINTHLKNHRGQTALDIAINGHSKEIIKLLCDARDHPDKKS